MSITDEIRPNELERVAVGIRSGQLPFPPTELALGRSVQPERVPALMQLIESWTDKEISKDGIAILLQTIADERKKAARQKSPELVWTGPEQLRGTTRDTSIVVSDLFRQARKVVTVSTFNLYDGAALFEPIREAFHESPNLRVRIFLDLAHLRKSKSLEECMNDFRQTFVRHHWPSALPLPEVFFDARSFSEKVSSVLHAKCVVIDDQLAFLTSANFTEAAHRRNIEVGVLLDDPQFARQLRNQFDNLVEESLVDRIPFEGR